MIWYNNSCYDLSLLFLVFSEAVNFQGQITTRLQFHIILIFASELFSWVFALNIDGLIFQSNNAESFLDFKLRDNSNRIQKQITLEIGYISFNCLFVSEIMRW